MEDVKSTVKGATKSKMIWLAIALGVLGPVLEVMPELKTFLAEYYGPALAVLSGVVGGLRVMTTTALKEK